MLKVIGFNWLKAHPFQDFGLKISTCCAPYTLCDKVFGVVQLAAVARLVAADAAFAAAASSSPAHLRGKAVQVDIRLTLG